MLKATPSTPVRSVSPFYVSTNQRINKSTFFKIKFKLKFKNTCRRRACPGPGVGLVRFLPEFSGLRSFEMTFGMLRSFEMTFWGIGSLELQLTITPVITRNPEQAGWRSNLSDSGSINEMASSLRSTPGWISYSISCLFWWLKWVLKSTHQRINASTISPLRTSFISRQKQHAFHRYSPVGNRILPNVFPNGWILGTFMVIQFPQCLPELLLKRHDHMCFTAYW